MASITEALLEAMSSVSSGSSTLFTGEEWCCAYRTLMTVCSLRARKARRAAGGLRTSHSPEWLRAIADRAPTVIHA
ncbi:hypothetical protein Y032_0400g769 [Ancylostoma ceylanicum]|uniref:Uncharacterized protein n=1 Tax=Ancylostoma ceylanicum TaxID=53326 RepID=A0A016RS29_9BILA|nr:hypothetical protein Y032_0400g769 [Ancylostoma ceylanicum]